MAAMNLNLSFLQSFLAVATSGSFTVAAKKLFITQPAVSQHIHALEKELGVKLFMRRGRGIALTDEGKYLKKKTEELMQTLQDLQASLQDRNELRRGKIRLAATELPVYLLPPVLLEFKNRYPGVEISIVSDTTPNVVHMVDNGEADIGFARKMFENLPRMECGLVHVEHLVLAAPSWHPLQDRKLITPPMLVNEALALRERGTFTHECAMNWFKGHETPTNIIESNTMAALREMVLYGCLAFLPRGVISLDIIRKRILALPTSISATTMEYHFYSRKNEQLSKPVATFLDLLTNSGQFSLAHTLMGRGAK